MAGDFPSGSAMKVSVITPAYNAEAYLTQAIESVLSQSCPVHEMVIVDNGSTDRTKEIANSFGPPVRVLSLPNNIRPSGARNAAVQIATGDWLAFLDADDWFLPGKILKMTQLAGRNSKAVLLYSGVLNSYGGETRKAPFTPPSGLWPSMRYSCRFEVASVLLRKDAFEAVGGFNPATTYGEDWELWYKLQQRFSIAAFDALEEPLAVYRRTPNSLSTNAIAAFEATKVLLDALLRDTHGLNRSLWRHRILAFKQSDTAILLREQGNPQYLAFMLRSLLTWPFPGTVFPMRRYKIFASMLTQRIRGGPTGLNSSWTGA
jgi:glycosyltransferase involved in cell wall biosynthesis